MTAIPAQLSQQEYFFSEVFPLSLARKTIISFQTNPEIDRELGNRLSYRLCQLLGKSIAILDEGKFWILNHSQEAIPDENQCQEALTKAQQNLGNTGDLPLLIKGYKESAITEKVLSKLAVQILKTQKFYQPILVHSVEKVEVNRKLQFWPESFEFQNQLFSALGLTIRTEITYKGNLANFYASNSSIVSPEELLIGLPVRNFDSDGSGVVKKIIGELREHRQNLLNMATNLSAQKAIQTAPDNELVVAIQFKKGGKLFYYPLSALRPSITVETAKMFGFDYGQLLRHTKILYQDRKKLLIYCKDQANKALINYDLKLYKSLNSFKCPPNFSLPNIVIAQTPLLFGKGHKGIHGQMLNGLSAGGVYRRHPDFQSEMIRISVLKLCNQRVSGFYQAAQERLKKYKFDSEIIARKEILVNTLDAATARAEVEKAVDELNIVPVDIMLIFLPTRDREADNDDGGSLYQLIYSLLLRRKIASQFIYEDTLKTVGDGYILNQVIPGILAKLGNLPFILAEPLPIADYFIGLDISRSPKTKSAGSMNACASIRLYGKQGEFIRYAMEDALIEGEEIPQRLLERLLPTNLEGKTVLIYRDGRFCGQEVPRLLERAKAIQAKFILVECRKSGVPRLYKSIKSEHKKQATLTAPPEGLTLYLSPREALLVTTKVSEKIGLARPIRLTIHEASEPASIEQVVETTLKLTLLHHGALKAPRLPMPIFGADRVAGLRLQGIYPSSALEGDRQFWL
jgi:hypothetical protein